MPLKKELRVRPSVPPPNPPGPPLPTCIRKFVVLADPKENYKKL